MENRERRNPKGNNMRGILYVIYIAFCIFAVTEIIYGRVQLKETKEQLKLEQEKNQEIQELLDGSAADSNKDMAMQEEPTEEEPAIEDEAEPNDANQDGDLDNQDKTDENLEEPVWVEDNDKEYDMQIVFMGDSILDNVREYDGVASLISDSCNAKVYNMSMGGTTAALLQNEQYNFDEWDSRSLLGVVNAILGNVDKDVFSGYQAKAILEHCDFSKTDYFVIEYGVNDFLSKVPISRYLEDGSTRDVDDVHTYVGALETAITLLQGAFPNATIMLISPHYCQFFSGEVFVGDAYSIDNGYATLVGYSDICRYVYDQNKGNNVIFFDTFADSGINAYTADKYLEDGIHLSAEGRHVYADYASRLLKANFSPME